MVNKTTAQSGEASESVPHFQAYTVWKTFFYYKSFLKRKIAEAEFCLSALLIDADIEI